MAGIQLIIDPEEAPLALSVANGFHVLSPLKCVAAQAQKQWTSNIDTEGELPGADHTQNAQIILRVRLFGTSEEDFRLKQLAFEQKYNKLSSEGGVLRIVYPDGSYIDWPVRDISGGELLIENPFLHSFRTEDEVTFVCAPFGEGEEELIGEFEGEGRVLECLIDDLDGSAMALGRAVVSSPESDVFDLAWGLESRSLSEAATAKPHYGATELTPLGGATITTATVDGKASVPVVHKVLTPGFVAALSTQLPGIGQLTHEGVYEVYAWVNMPTSNTGEVAILLEYGVGDLSQRTELDATYFAPNHAREGQVVKVTLGQVVLRASGKGQHQWEGRITPSSTVTGDVLNILDIGLRPLEEGSGRMTVSPALHQPSALLTHDEFLQNANLNEQVIAAASLVSGPKSPTSGADAAGPGTNAWSSPGSIVASDGAVARASLAAAGAGGLASHYLVATNFGFAIPTGATIQGIVAEVQGAQIFSHSIRDSRVHLVKGGTIQTGDRARGEVLPVTLGGTSFPYRQYGGPADLFGATLLYSDVNATTFGLALAYESLGEGEVEINHVRLTVYYTTSTGQKWASTGDSVDIAVAEGTAHRSEVSDADINTGRYAVAGATTSTDVVAGIAVKRSSVSIAPGEEMRLGVLARYTDTSNYLLFALDANAAASPLVETLKLLKRVGGTVTELQSFPIPSGYEQWKSLYIFVDHRGRYYCWAVLIEGGAPMLVMAGQDNDLAEGGTLASGKSGFYDVKIGSGAAKRSYDNFVVWTPPNNAVIFKGLSLELSHDNCNREIEGGGVSVDFPPEGDYLRLLPAGMEDRKNRLVFIASPNDPELMGVGFPQPLTVALYGTPRYRTVPNPA